MFKNLVISLILAIASFVLGMEWQAFQYNDICLDMGGGENPSGNPICVVTKTIIQAEEKFMLNEQSEKLLGPWLIQGEDWGFALYDDGTASSINAATLVYQKWYIQKGKLCLTSRSIGNHTQSVSEECLSYSIKGEDGDAKLSIGKGDYKTIYNRT
jgi:hypothetical protein